MNDSVVKDADRIHEAINKDLKIGFRYFHYSPATRNEKRYSKSGNQYIVSPYALLWNNGNYYLYAYDSEKQKFRYFRVDRMERISQPLPYHREGKAEYKEKDITSQKAKVFDMYGGKEYTTRIRKVIVWQWVLRSKTLGEATVPLKMARDEARHGVALKGMLERYFK